MKHKNYYEILEISENATSSEIKRAYYSLCKKYHPDVNPGTANLFCNINEAYETLIDPVKRKCYDESLKEPETSNTQEHFYESESKHDFYYTNPRYYQDPSKEPIVNILDDLKYYRFENAMNAIWNRNWFVLIGNTLICTIITFAVLFNRIAKLFKKSLISKKYYSSIWINFIFDSMRENTLFRFLFWTILLLTITAFKTIWIGFKIIMFIYTKIMKPLFLPIGIILASLFHSNNSYRRY